MGLSTVPPPSPLVLRFLHGRNKLRKGRGFSLDELKQAGLQESQARSMGIRIDPRRSTVHAQNVSSLAAFLASPTNETEVPEPSTEAPGVVVKAKRSATPSKKRAKPRTKAAAKRKR
jgi:large subunit ribosomal protein L13e